jgi:DNA (cytosine-5)-methyltransferase 1
MKYIMGGMDKENRCSFYTVDEVAEILKISRRTVLKLIYEKKIKAIKIGNRWRIPAQDFKIKLCDLDRNRKYKNTKVQINRALICNIEWVKIKKEELNKTYPQKYTCVDLFSGAGGLSLGFELAGFQCIAALDIYSEAVETYKYNFPNVKVFKADIRRKDVKESLIKFVKEKLKEMNKKTLDVLIGGPPCQGFSLAGFRLVEDPRNNLYKDFLEIANELKPKFIVIENVEGLRSFLNGKVEEKILQDLKKIGYCSSVATLNAVWYGVPQYRKRVIFIANNRTNKNFYPKPIFLPNEYKTVKDAIEDLLDHPEDRNFNHIFTKHKKDTIERLKKVPQGGTLYPNFQDAWKRPYWNKPAPTVKENHGGVHIHPLLPRVMTPRELARLQSFPDTFIFKGSKKHQLIQIGNAVPPLMAKAIALAIRKYLERLP